MQKNKKTRMFNFLIELLLVIVIFAISSIVVVKMFYSGYAINKENEELNDAMFIASDIAEQMRIYNGENLTDYLDYQKNAKYEVDVEVERNAMHIVYTVQKSQLKILKKCLSNIQ